MTNFSIFQIVLSLIAIVFLLKTIILLIKRESRQPIIKTVTFIVMWTTVLTFTLNPEISHAISQKLGMGENLNTLIFLGFVLVFILIFKLLNKIDRVEQSITEIVRAEALQQLHNKENKPKK